VFGLDLFQVGVLLQAVDWVALVVEPLAASSIDHSSRRRLIAWGAGALAVSMALMAVAPSFWPLLVAFALYGVGAGPVAHTADVVVLESFPTEPDRAYSRASLLDTCGALLGPVAVAVALSAGLSWRVVLAVLAVLVGLYGWAANRATFSPPPRTRRAGESVLGALVSGLRSALSHGEIRRALLVLLAFDVFEAGFVLQYVWLHDEVGLSEPAVALWAVGEHLVGLVALLVLDRWLSDRLPVRILQAATGALVVLPALWIAVPGVAGKVLVGIPLAFATAIVWPLAKARSLTVAPELAGATQAVTTLYPVLPLALVEGWLASTIGTGPAMAATAAVGAALMLALTLSSRPRGSDEAPPGPSGSPVASPSP
jgi:MFS family permease